MNPVVKRMLIIFGSVVGLLLIGSVVYNFFFGPGTLLVTAKQDKTVLTIDSQKPIEVSFTQSIPLTSGKHNIKASRYGYEDQQTEVTIDARQTTELNINLTAKDAPQNASTKTINFDEQLRSQIDPNKYTITKVQYFENNTWAVVFMKLNVPQTQSNISILRYDFNSGKWNQPIPPAEVYDNKVRDIVPASVYDYLSANRKIIKTSNP